MIRRNPTFTVLLVLILTFFTASCTGSTESTTAPMQVDIYSPAVEEMDTFSTIAVALSIDKITTIANETLTQSQNTHIIYKDRGTDRMITQAEGTLEYANYQVEIQEYFYDNCLYLSVNNSKFRGAVQKTDYLKNQLPLKLLDPSLYENITLSELDDITTLTFSDPFGGELWALPEDAEFQSASGTAALDATGALDSATYEITYCLGAAQIKAQYQVNYSVAEDVQIQKPSAKDYITLKDVYGPLYLEQAFGYLQQSLYLNATLTENIFSEANSIYFDQNTMVERYNNEACINTSVSLTDASRGGEISSYSQIERFKDGSYTISTDGGAPVEQSRIDSRDMNAYCTNLLTSNILSPTYVTECYSAVQDNNILFKFTAGEALAQTICEDSCETIYQDAGFLDSMANHYENYAVEYYLSIDKYTGLPTASGLYYSGIHNIEGIDYKLITQYDQTYNINSQDP